MPNHVTNVLTVIGEGYEEVIESLKGKVEYENIITKEKTLDDCEFDFNRVIPKPKSLDCPAGSGGDGAYNLLYGDWKKEVELWKHWDSLKADGDNLPMLPGCLDMAVAATPKKYPATRKAAIKYANKRYSDRYDWELGKTYKGNEQTHGHRNWYGWCIENWGTKWGAYDISVDGNAVSFLTAWSMPEPIIRELSKKFPKCKFQIEWADEDFGQNCGRIIFEDGIELDVFVPEGGSNEAYEFALKLRPEMGEYLEKVGNEYRWKE